MFQIPFCLVVTVSLCRVSTHLSFQQPSVCLFLHHPHKDIIHPSIFPLLHPSSHLSFHLHILFVLYVHGFFVYIYLHALWEVSNETWSALQKSYSSIQFKLLQLLNNIVTNTFVQFFFFLLNGQFPKWTPLPPWCPSGCGSLTFPKLCGTHFISLLGWFFPSASPNRLNKCE